MPYLEYPGRPGQLELLLCDDLDGVAETVGRLERLEVVADGVVDEVVVQAACDHAHHKEGRVGGAHAQSDRFRPAVVPARA